jgi:hypothetical protein
LQVIKETNFQTVDALAPVLTTGVPSCELFFDDWLPPEFRSTLRGFLASVDVPQRIWGADYSSLVGTYKVESQARFFSELSKINHHYKGMHPVRFSKEAQEGLVGYVLANRLWNMSPKSNEITSISESPYFCNNLFACRRDFYVDVVQGIRKGSLFSDGFDEVAINQLLDRRGRRIQFARGVLGIHPSYNTVPESNEITAKFFEEISRQA